MIGEEKKKEMKESGSVKKAEKKDYDEELDKIFIGNFGFTPDALSTIHDTLKETHDIIHDYVKTIHVSDESRERVGRLSLESDLLLLDCNDLYAHGARFEIEAKKEFLLNKKANVLKSEADEFGEKFENTRQKIIGLIARTKEYIQKIKY